MTAMSETDSHRLSSVLAVTRIWVTPRSCKDIADSCYVSVSQVVGQQTGMNRPCERALINSCYLYPYDLN